MDDTHVLIDEQSGVTVVVRKAFNPSKKTFYNWVLEGLMDYLHNPIGPAFILRDQNKNVIIEQWWIDGEILYGEDLEKFRHKLNFGSRVEDLLD